MCIIIVKDGTETPSSTILKNASTSNRDGLGVLWLDTWEVTKHDSKDWKILETDRDYVAHFRYATVGKVDKSNVHPFNISKNRILFQNGTNSNLGSTNKTDTQHLAEILKEIPQRYYDNILSITESRYVVADLKKKQYNIYNKEKWVYDEKGNAYSKEYNDREYNYYAGRGSEYNMNNWSYGYGNGGNNNNYSEDDYSFYDMTTSDPEDNFLIGDSLAVYGNLKTEKAKKFFFKDCICVGEAETLYPYKLIPSSIPHLVNSSDIEVDDTQEVVIYEINSVETINKLDKVKKDFYREPIPILLPDGEIRDCWIYFSKTFDPKISRLPVKL